MKARVKATGEIVEIIKIEDNLFIDNHYYQYEPYQIEWEINDNDYWTRLEHQYAGMAMQGILSMPVYGSNGSEVDQDAVIECAMEYAHALVEKLKES